MAAARRTGTRKALAQRPKRYTTTASVPRSISSASRLPRPWASACNSSYLPMSARRSSSRLGGRLSRPSPAPICGARGASIILATAFPLVLHPVGFARHDPRRHAHHRAIGRHIGQHDGVRAHHHVVAYFYAAQHLRPGAQENVVAQLRRLRLAAQVADGHILEHDQVLADLRVADENAGEVVDRESPADVGTYRNID